MTCRSEAGHNYNQMYITDNRLFSVLLMKLGAGCPAAHALAAPANTLAACPVHRTGPSWGVGVDIRATLPELRDNEE